MTQFKDLLTIISPSVKNLAQEVGTSTTYIRQVALGQKAGLRVKREMIILARRQAKQLLEGAEKLENELGK